MAIGRHHGAPLSRIRCIHRAYIRLGLPADRSLVLILLVQRTSPRALRHGSVLLRRRSVLLRRPPYAPCLRCRPCALPTRRWRLSALLAPDLHSMYLPVTALTEFVIARNTLFLTRTAPDSLFLTRTAPDSLFLPRAGSRPGLLGGGGGRRRLPGRLPGRLPIAISL